MNLPRSQQVGRATEPFSTVQSCRFSVSSSYPTLCPCGRFYMSDSSQYKVVSGLRRHTRLSESQDAWGVCETDKRQTNEKRERARAREKDRMRRYVQSACGETFNVAICAHHNNIANRPSHRRHWRRVMVATPPRLVTHESQISLAWCGIKRPNSKERSAIKSLNRFVARATIKARRESEAR